MIPITSGYAAQLAPATTADRPGGAHAQMTNGIDTTQAVGVFITQRFVWKACGKGENGLNDNCKFEVC